MAESAHKLDDFDRLYGEVTSRLLAYVQDPSTPLATHERVWFLQLIKNFIAAYQTWNPQHPQPEIEAYLRRFDKWFLAREVRLAGHAFLHIAYDLPRVMSQMLALSAVERTRQGQIFVQVGPLFSKTFLDWVASGNLGLIRKLFPPAAMRVMAFWVLALRTTAWIHANVIQDLLSYSQLPSSDVVEQSMGRALNKAADKALGQTWILGIPELNNADMLQALPILRIAGLTIQRTTAAVVALAAVASFAMAWWLRRRRRTTLTIEVLGALVNGSVQQALRGVDDNNPQGRTPALA